MVSAIVNRMRVLRMGGEEAPTADALLAAFGLSDAIVDQVTDH